MSALENYLRVHNPACNKSRIGGDGKCNCGRDLAAAEFASLQRIEKAARKLDKATKPQEEADAILELRAALKGDS